jgi:predicted phosphodiesterase
LKALIISDSHGNISFLKDIIKTAKNIADFEQIWHLGDEYEDMDYIDFCGIVKKVPGTRHPLYFTNESARILSFSAGKFEITLIHSPYDIPKNLVGTKRIFLYGHLHQPKMAECGSGILASPGHIANSFDRGSEASFFIFEEEQNSAKLSLFNMFGDLKLNIGIENLNNELKIK